MNRTALCIKMLMLLKARGMMSTNEIASELETNPRNIREFKKELITAGYHIIETRGRYGGYYLDETSLFPSLGLSSNEILALKDSRGIIRSHPEFDIKQFDSALDKILSADKDVKEMTRYYINQPVLELSKKEKDMISICQEAQKDGLSIQIKYQTLHQKESLEFLVDPYEIIHYKNTYYIIGFSHRRNDYRIYRFSEQRMHDCKISSHKFLRDPDFHISNFIGQQSLIKGDFIKIEIAVSNSHIRMFKEQYWGLDFQETKDNEKTICSFMSENPSIVYQQLFVFKNHVEILTPDHCRKEYHQMIKDILHIYDR